MQPGASPTATSEGGDAEARQDAIERAVRAKLWSDPELQSGGSIVVLVDGDRVILEGWVGSENERTLAEADAATVPGVRQVDNRLLVRPWALHPSGDR